MPFRCPNTCVLIVDDDPDDLFLSRHLVERAEPSSQVVAARGGAEAMNYLLQATNPTEHTVPLPALILADVNMPGLDGFELLRWIRRNHQLAEVKVVMLSSSQSASDIKRATQLGAHGFLIKHPNPSLMTCVLHQAFGMRDGEAEPEEGEPQSGDGDLLYFPLPSDPFKS